jgi:solute carrier family 6 amino acid transporter-like protein 5/7/9/14
MIGICWIYGSFPFVFRRFLRNQIFGTIISGLDNFVKDIEFMLNIKLWNYWKLTWAYIIPITLLIIFVYTSATYVVDDIGPGPYPPAIIGMFTAFVELPMELNGTSALERDLGVGWTLGGLVLLQIPLWAMVVVFKQKHGVTWFQVRTFELSEKFL